MRTTEFPRTRRRPSFEFPPSPLPLLRDCTLVRNEVHFDPRPQKKVFFPCWHFSSLLPVFIITREPPSHETRQHPRCSLSLVKRVIRNAAGKFVENPKRVQPFRARVSTNRSSTRRKRETFSPFLLFFQDFAPRRSKNSYSFPRILTDIGKNQDASYFLLQIRRGTCDA